MKQIKIASSAKITNKWGQLSSTKNILMLGRTTYLTIQSSRATLVLMSLFNRSFTSCWIVARAYCSLRNEIKTCWLLNELKLCNFRNGNLQFAKWKMCRSVICINRIAENLRPPTIRMNRSVHYQRDHIHNLTYNNNLGKKERKIFAVYFAKYSLERLRWIIRMRDTTFYSN